MTESSKISSTLPDNPAVFKVLDDGTVLYKTYRDAENAALEMKGSPQKESGAVKMSQARLGATYPGRDGKPQTSTIGGLVEFQLTGLIVVVLVLAGLSIVCSLTGRLIKRLEQGTRSQPLPQPSRSPDSAPSSETSVHPGLSEQQLVVLLTAAATEAVGDPVRVEKFRPFSSRDWNWAAQGRMGLHSHRLK